MYEAGNTLQQIATHFGVSRQRIHQLLKPQGMARATGGQHVRTQAKRQAADAAWVANKGMTKDDWRQAVANGWLEAYRSQRKNATMRGIAWELTFPEWLQIWLDSGKLSLRGRGHGKYVMARHLDLGPYAVGNVRIMLADENNREWRSNKAIALQLRKD